MRAADIAVHAHWTLPRDVAILCRDCGAAVPLVMFVDEGWPKRQVRCPACAGNVVLQDAW